MGGDRMHTAETGVEQLGTPAHGRSSPAVTRASSDSLAGVLRLQRLIGNQAVCRLAASGVMQAKLQVGPAGDSYEREADQVAAQVMRNLAASVTPGEEATGLRRSAVAGVVGLEGGPVEAETEAAIQRDRGRGSRLPDPLRRSMENSFGADFGGVRVHTDQSADRLNGSLQSRAFTTGSDIFFARNEYQPQSKQGQALLAHELTHTIQQGAVRRETVKEKPGASQAIPRQHSIGDQAVGRLLSDGPVSALDHTRTNGHRDDRSASAPWIAQRSGRGNQVVQRLLGAGNPLQVQDVATVTRVDSKVWILQGNQQDSVVLKIELPQAGEGTAGFAARHEYVTWLAQQVLAGVPNAQVLTPTEEALLAQLPPEADPRGLGGPTFTLNAIVTNPQGPVVFLKVATVNMSKNLEARIAEQQQLQQQPQQQGGWGQLPPTSPKAIIKRSGTLKELGKMAVFDLLVNNADRFRPMRDPTGLVNMKNIDFDQAAQPIAIDNLDPNNRLLSADEAKDLFLPEWEGEQRVTTRRARLSYAMEAVKDIMTAVGGVATDLTTLKPYITKFHGGMEEAVTALPPFGRLLRRMGGLERGTKKKVANIIAARIDQLQ